MGQGEGKGQVTAAIGRHLWVAKPIADWRGPLAQVAALTGLEDPVGGLSGCIGGKPCGVENLHQ